MVTLRNALLAGTGLVLLGSPAFAAGNVYSRVPNLYSPVSVVNGDLSFGIGETWANSSGANEHATTWEAIARASVPIKNNWKFEGEFNDTGYFNFSNGAPSDLSINAFNGYAHAYYQNQRFALGVVAGAGSWFEGLSSWTGGVEGQYYLRNYTWYGSVLYTDLHEGGDSVKIWSTKVGGAYYFNPNTKAAWAVLFDCLRAPFGPHVESIGVSGEFAHRWTGTPWSAFVQASWFNTHDSSDHVDTTRLVAGLSLSLDGQGTSLQAHDMAVPFTTDLGVLSQSPIFGSVSVVSDRRLKRDIVLLGRLSNGLGLYRYRYLWSDTVYVGVMAQEVATVIPEAVIQGADGYLRVNYSLLGMQLMTWEDWLASDEDTLAEAPKSWPALSMEPEAFALGQ